MNPSIFIIEKILNDNFFSLEMAGRLSEITGKPVKQITIEAQARRKSRLLLNPEYIQFYKEKGFEESDYMQKQSAE